MRRLVAAALLAAVGCGDESTGPTAVHPVTGKITVGGSPAAGVLVFFYPTSNPNPADAKMNPHGVTDASGAFTLTTYAKDDGAPEGGYQVILFWPPPAVEGEEESDTDQLLGWFDAKHSTLDVQVKEGANALPPFNLPKRTTPPGASQGIPGRN